MEQDPSTIHNAWIRNGKVLNQVLALICCRSKMGTRHLGGTNNQKTQRINAGISHRWCQKLSVKFIANIDVAWRNQDGKLDIKPSYRVCLNTIQCHEKITSNAHLYLQLLILWLDVGTYPLLYEIFSHCALYPKHNSTVHIRQFSWSFHHMQVYRSANISKLWSSNTCQ